MRPTRPVAGHTAHAQVAITPAIAPARADGAVLAFSFQREEGDHAGVAQGAVVRAEVARVRAIGAWGALLRPHHVFKEAHAARLAQRPKVARGAIEADQRGKAPSLAVAVALVVAFGALLAAFGLKALSDARVEHVWPPVGKGAGRRGEHMHTRRRTAAPRRHMRPTPPLAKVIRKSLGSH